MAQQLVAYALALMLASSIPLLPTSAETGRDKYGGLLNVIGHRAVSFHVEKIGSRWWLVTPDGHGIFIRAVSKVDTTDFGGSGGLLAYDAVYLQMAAGELSPNLRLVAENSRSGDVVHPATQVTLHLRGDALYLGSSRCRPNFTYFWLERLGEGGRVKWYYSTAEGWEPVQNTGKPWHAEAVGEDGNWHLDRGNYMAPDEHGFGQWGSRHANKVTWWDMSKGFPAGFAPVRVAQDSQPCYFLKGVVERDYSVPPILSQTYERADLSEWIARKYGPGDYYRKWAAAMTERLRQWGFNAAGQYSYRYVSKLPGLRDSLPVAPTWALGGWATRHDRPYRVKNVYAGAVFPPGSQRAIWQGIQPDVFEPGIEKAYRELVHQQLPLLPAAGRSWALVPEEADELFGLNSLTHDHLGYVVLSQNPFQPRAYVGGRQIEYADPRLYAKYALRDFLRDRYRAPEDTAPGFTDRSSIPAYEYQRPPAGWELAALEKLNAAWGTAYTTWDTSEGDLLRGDNAWGRGSGFLDENGRNVLADHAACAAFDQDFTRPTHPAIRRDLDDFLRLFAARYGKVLGAAFAKRELPPLLLPVYNGPSCVYEELAPHVDGFWVRVSDPQDAVRIYHAGRKPLVVADYLTADPDSPWYFKAAISALRYDRARDTTTIVAPELRYVFRSPQAVAFPDAPALAESYRKTGRPYPWPRVKSAYWDTLELAGDYTRFLRPGEHVELWKQGNYPYARSTQEDRARDMIRHYQSLLGLRGDDGLYFVMGIEHWCLYDPAVSNWSDNQNFGLATAQDNAYDGVEARRAIRTDAAGYAIGGEDRDYGNVVGGLSRFWQLIEDRLAGR